MGAFIGVIVRNIYMIENGNDFLYDKGKMTTPFVTENVGLCKRKEFY